MKRKSSTKDVSVDVPPTKLPLIRHSEEGQMTLIKGRYVNRQRLLIFASRGISFQIRHLMKDFRSMLPHAKTESKMEKRDSLVVINEICETRNCNKCIFFEGHRKLDSYVWMSAVPNGPSMKFYLENVHTSGELKLSGNCLKGSRPLISFDPSFDSEPHWRLMKELFTQLFGTPRYHPRSQPFVDHVITFTILDNRIWFRNYQMIEEDGSMAEIGPRFVLNPVKIFADSFRGETVWENPKFIPPAVQRRRLKLLTQNRPLQKAHDRLAKDEKLKTTEKAYKTLMTSTVDDVFH